MDTYKHFEELRRSELQGAFTIRQRKGSSSVAVMAPHGGGIEPGTSELADAVAGAEHAFYAFEGMKRSGNRDLHITGTNFDEPVGVATAARSHYVLTLHGCADGEEISYIGGLDQHLKERLRVCLVEAGFKVDEAPRAGLAGNHPNNICNRGRTRRGVQIEVSAGLRELMFADLHSSRGRTISTSIFDEFVWALRRALDDILNQ